MSASGNAQGENIAPCISLRWKMFLISAVELCDLCVFCHVQIVWYIVVVSF
jgi:hypothetical protein